MVGHSLGPAGFAAGAFNLPLQKASAPAWSNQIKPDSENMFDDARKLQQLFNDIKFGFQTISDNPAVDGNQVRIISYCRF